MKTISRFIANRSCRLNASIAVVLLACGLLISVRVSAQSERKLIRDGNTLYKQKKFGDAEVNYRKSINLNKNSVPGNYNLGNAYYKQGKFEEAEKQYQELFSSKSLSDEDKAKSFHNLGNSYLKDKKFNESIEAYKNALKLNPKDNDTRYNLAYAQAMIQQQQQQQQNKDGKNQDQKGDKNQQQQNKDGKDQKKGQEQEQQQKEGDQKDKQDQTQAQKKKGISKEDAEKILQALNNDEKNTQKKLNKKEAVRMSIEKQW